MRELGYQTPPAPITDRRYWVQSDEYVEDTVSGLTPGVVL